MPLLFVLNQQRASVCFSAYFSVGIDASQTLFYTLIVVRIIFHLFFWQEKPNLKTHLCQLWHFLSSIYVLTRASVKPGLAFAGGFHLAADSATDSNRLRSQNSEKEKEPQSEQSLWGDSHGVWKRMRTCTGGSSLGRWELELYFLVL